jgi:peptidoglycan biosynthesis protein MviN/MurJ (putative lipid II flippase)
MRTSGRDPLAIAAVAFVAANLLHTLDHFRQGVSGLSTTILAGGTALSVLAVVVMVMALRRHPRAPAFCAVVGLSGAVGIASSHLLPHWSSLSDSYPEIHADALSWVVVMIEIGAALALAVVAIRELRRQAAQPQHA